MTVDFKADGAIVNIPLSKRGNIDMQIDRYKADQEKQKRADHKAWKEAKAPLIAEARRLFDAAPDRRLPGWPNGMAGRSSKCAHRSNRMFGLARR
jgi:hypothetical protein